MASQTRFHRQRAAALALTCALVVGCASQDSSPFGESAPTATESPASSAPTSNASSSTSTSNPDEPEQSTLPAATDSELKGFLLEVSDPLGDVRAAASDQTLQNSPVDVVGLTARWFENDGRIEVDIELAEEVTEPMEGSLDADFGLERAGFTEFGISFSSAWGARLSLGEATLCSGMYATEARTVRVVFPVTEWCLGVPLALRMKVGSISLDGAWDETEWPAGDRPFVVASLTPRPLPDEPPRATGAVDDPIGDVVETLEDESTQPAPDQRVLDLAAFEVEWFPAEPGTSLLFGLHFADTTPWGYTGNIELDVDQDRTADYWVDFFDGGQPVIYDLKTDNMYDDEVLCWGEIAEQGTAFLKIEFTQAWTCLPQLGAVDARVSVSGSSFSDSSSWVSVSAPEIVPPTPPSSPDDPATQEAAASVMDLRGDGMRFMGLKFPPEPDPLSPLDIVSLYVDYWYRPALAEWGYSFYVEFNEQIPEEVFGAFELDFDADDYPDRRRVTFSTTGSWFARVYEGNELVCEVEITDDSDFEPQVVLYVPERCLPRGPELRVRLDAEISNAFMDSTDWTVPA